jgi:hypothetical protein
MMSSLSQNYVHKDNLHKTAQEVEKLDTIPVGCGSAMVPSFRLTPLLYVGGDTRKQESCVRSLGISKFANTVCDFFLS